MRGAVTMLLGLMVTSLLVLIALPALAETHTVRNGNRAAPGQCASTDEAYTYEPADLSIAVGDTVVFENPAVHSNGCSADDHPTQCLDRSDGDCPWSQGELPPGESFEVTFPAEGTFQYVCLRHPYMEGVIVVGDGDPAEPEPTSEPEPEPTSDQPTSDPEPELTSEPSPPADDADDGDNGPTGEGTPADQTPTDEATAEPAADDTPAEELTSDDTPTTELSPIETRADDDTSDQGTAVERSEDTDAASQGTVPKAIAAVLVLGVAGALWAARRGG